MTTEQGKFRITFERDKIMKRTPLLALLLAFVTIAGLTPDASAYYHAGMGRFISRDPMPYADGGNLYEYCGSGPTCAVDPSGTKCVVCSSGIRYRVDIGQLDAHVVDQGYSKAAKVWEDRYRKDSVVKTWHITIPHFTSSAPVALYSPEFLEREVDPPEKMAAGTMGLALYLFFVDFEVCNPDDCVLELYETRHQQRWDPAKKSWKELEPNAEEKPIDSPPPWGGPLRLSKRAHDLGGCTHTIIVADMPGISSRLKPSWGGRLPPEIFTISARQRIVVKDKASGDKASEVIHEFRVGFDASGRLVASP